MVNSVCVTHKNTVLRVLIQMMHWNYKEHISITYLQYMRHIPTYTAISASCNTDTIQINKQQTRKNEHRIATSCA